MTGRTDVPDVTVVVAVYNTMPYLTECLDSLIGQTIGTDRLEVVAVDDGSTDDSGAELDRFAERYPNVVKVVHQPNSGGPAAPSNRALELATGRYVYFIGSDDHLGEEALERMVACADRNESDVVVGKMVGTNGRYVRQSLYKANDPDVSLYGPELPFALANTKLFRRELVEKHKLRFPEDLPVGSDQPFTIEACYRARKISVVADYTCYYAVKRGDASNITYRADHLARLRCTAAIMDHAAGLIEAGPNRDALFKRHFTWELSKLIQGDFVGLDDETKRDICAGITRLADTYLTDPLSDSLPVKLRARLRLAQRGAVDELCRAISEEAEHGAPPFHLEDGRAFALYPGFRDAGLELPDRCFELVGEIVPGRLANKTELVESEWVQTGEELALSLTVRVGVVGDTGSAIVRLVEGAMPKSADKARARPLPDGHDLPPAQGELTRTPAPDGDATLLRALIPLARRTVKRGVRVFVDVAGETYEIPVRGDGRPMPLARRWSRETDPYRAAARLNSKGRMVISTGPLHPPKPSLGSRLRSRLTGAKRSKRK
ncbi:glycosyltransferase [Streptomyces sp. NBC_00873]|uniref:glycosyltransferase family 2 protein n=1 Tax=unclassified Streptomyces TaxID=2593676 RepID=UPI00386EE65F|nr:glycosyltransferase [Streptomyces sp. NBC_00873]WTA43767.1 glycosyltransferase [Streptomyces sp. NBC_00842]